jgi:hypothetical protein
VRSHKYLIVGGGMTGDSVARGIREHDKDGSIGLVSAESHPPYSRPPLSKALWQGKDESSIWRGTEDLGVDLTLGRRIVALDLDKHTATDDAGEEYGYERLVLATGGTPRKLDDAPDAIYYRTYDDYRQLREVAADGASVLVVGGGFIGSEIAAALQSNGANVTMVFPGDGVGANLFPADLSRSSTDYYREKGVDVRTGERASPELLANADVVVAGLGIDPTPTSRPRPACPSTTASSSTTAAGSAVARTSLLPATWPASPRPRSEPRRASSTRITRTRTGGSSARTWPARTGPTTTCPSSTPTSSTSATRLSARSTRGTRPSSIGRSRAARALSPTWIRKASRGDSCSGTSGARSTTPER